jgi:hypothetical protein
MEWIATRFTARLRSKTQYFDKRPHFLIDNFYLNQYHSIDLVEFYLPQALSSLVQLLKWIFGNNMGPKPLCNEQSSYSAMLNIAESVPPPEPVPSNPGNSIVIQYNRPTRHWPSSVNSWNSGNSIRFRNSGHCFQFRNQTEFLGIGWNWFRGQNWFRNVQHRGIGCILCVTNFWSTRQVAERLQFRGGSKKFQMMTRELKRASMSEFREFWTVMDFGTKITIEMK